MKVREWIGLLLAAISLTCPAAADDSLPLFYSRSNIIISRTHIPEVTAPLPWQKAEDIAAVANLFFDVEVRDAMTLYNQKGWFSLSSPLEKTGVLLVFPSPQIAPIKPSQQYAPLDILMIDKEGTITQIAPGIMMSQLEQDIVPTKPVLAFLFLKGGTCETLQIQPGDSVEYKLFKKPPVVLSAPDGSIVVPQRPSEPSKGGVVMY